MEIDDGGTGGEEGMNKPHNELAEKIIRALARAVFVPCGYENKMILTCEAFAIIRRVCAEHTKPRRSE